MSNLPERDDSGKYPTFAWPGGYPLIYLDKSDNVLCPDCANHEIDQAQAVVACDVYWEGPPISCDDCGAEIESAYGDPDEESET